MKATIRRSFDIDLTAEEIGELFGSLESHKQAIALEVAAKVISDGGKFPSQCEIQALYVAKDTAPGSLARKWISDLAWAQEEQEKKEEGR